MLDIKKLRKEMGLSQLDFARLMGVSRQTVVNYENGLPIPASRISFIEKMKDDFAGAAKKRKPEAEILPGFDEYSDAGFSKSGNHFLEHSSGQLIMSVPLVESYAYAGYPAGWNDPEYLEELPRHSITVEKHHKGVYRSFRVRGDSMDNDRRNAICAGDIVSGRSIERQYWQSKLHLHKYKYYVIVQEDGIIVKWIYDHDVEAGIVYCRSLNPDKELYPDFELPLSDILELYNIVSVDRKFAF